MVISDRIFNGTKIFHKKIPYIKPAYYNLYSCSGLIYSTKPDRFNDFYHISYLQQITRLLTQNTIIAKGRYFKSFRSLVA